MGSRYVIGEEIGSGGMATVHLGGMVGDAGFARTVAIKKLHPQYAKDPELSAMLLDEGKLAARIVHANVVDTLDVVAGGSDLFIVMEYVHGEPLNRLLRAVVRAGTRIPARVAAGIVAGALRGLHAAHEARDAYGNLLGVVHRDVSPQNIMVGTDGVPRVLDFGIAKVAGRAHTETGQIKGKFAYMSIEQLQGDVLDRRADVYAAGVVLWESLVSARLFTGADQAPNLAKLLDPQVDPPSARAPEIGGAYDAVVLQALARRREDRFPTALAMAEALEACAPVASPGEIGAWVSEVAGESLGERAQRIGAIERDLAQRIRDSRETLDALEETVTDASLLTGPVPIGATLAGSITGVPPSGDAATDVHDAITLKSPRAAPEPLPLPAPAARPSFARGALAAIGGLVAIGATLALVAGSRPRDGDAVSPADSTSAASASADGTASVAPAQVLPDAVSAEPPLPIVPPTATASSRAKASPARPARGKPADQTCSPPYTIDDRGHKHYKRACLK